MYEKPETPSEGMEQARAETPHTDSAPTTNTGDSYAPPPAYSHAPAQVPQYGYNLPPQEQHTLPPGYAPPPEYGYGPGQQGGVPTVSTVGPPVPIYQPGQYVGSYQPMHSQAPAGYGPGYGSPKDPTVGLLLELIGIAGFLGIGHIYAGKTTRGIVLLVGWLIYDLLLVTVIIPLVTVGSVLTCGVGCLLFLPLIAIWLGVPIGSGFYLKNEIQKEQAAMKIRR